MSATILVLEDDATLQELLCEVLQDEGYTVVAADTLPKLLAAVPADPSLLITDLLVDFHAVGLEAIEAIRNITRPTLPALICTAAQHQLDTLRPELMRLNAQELQKPFTIDDLVNAVSQALAAPATADVRDTAGAPAPSMLRTSFA